MKTKLLKKLKKKSYIKSRLYHWALKDGDNEQFYTFQCDSFFRGSILASYNMKIYKRRRKEICRWIKILKWAEEKLEAK